MANSHELLIVGDSHIRAFGFPLANPDGTNRLLSRDIGQGKVFGLVGAWPRQVDAYWDGVQENANGRTVCATWGGNTHLANFLFAPSPLFDFVLASNPLGPLDETVEIVPEAAIRELFAKPLRQVMSRLAALKSSGHRVIFFGSPPPKEDDDFIREYISRETYFERVASGLGLTARDVQLSPPVLRLKLWQALQDLMLDMAAEAGVAFLPVSRDTQTEEGFLHRDCYGDDVTHANRVFGDRMIVALSTAAAASEQ